MFIDGTVKEGCDLRTGNADDTPELGMDNVGGVFLVLLIGVSSACFVGVLEFLWNIRKVAIDTKVTALILFFKYHFEFSDFRQRQWSLLKKN